MFYVTLAFWLMFLFEHHETPTLFAGFLLFCVCVFLQSEVIANNVKVYMLKVTDQAITWDFPPSDHRPGG